MHRFPRVCSELRKLTAITESLAGVGDGKRAQRRLDEDGAAVVTSDGAKDAFECEAFRG